MKKCFVVLISIPFIIGIIFTSGVEAEEIIVQNDSIEDYNDADSVGDFATGEQAGVHLTSPVDGYIVAVQILWMEGSPGHDPSTEQAIHIFADTETDTFPTPGTELETIIAPLLTPGIMNEYRYIDENQQIPLCVLVAENQQFYITLEFANTTDIAAGGPSVVCDIDGCTEECNVYYTLGGGEWLDFCTSIEGDLVIRAIIEDNSNPIISNIVRNPESPGPGIDCEISANIIDPIDLVAGADLCYSIGAEYSCYSMGNVDDSFYFTIPGQAPGTTVYYFITAWDDGGDSTISDTSSYHINQGPIISNINQDPESPYPNQPCEVSAIITDLLLMASVNSALLCYNAGSYYNCVIMDNTADSFYASIPGQIEGDSVYYYIMAWDDYGDSTVSDTIGYEVSLSPCLPCNTITTTPLVPNIDGTIIWSMDINNCGPQTVPVYAEIYPTVGDCASGTQYDFNINRLAVSNLGAGDSATLYYWYRPGTVVGVIDAAINIDVGPAIDNYISNCCFEFIFAYEFGRPGTEISFGPGEWGERGGEEVLPTTTALNQNYPNPFNSTTTISFDIVQSGNVNLSVYNLAGQKIESLVDGRMNAGQHNITWDASTFSSGVYFYKLTTTGKTFTKRMTLLK